MEELILEVNDKKIILNNLIVYLQQGNFSKTILSVYNNDFRKKFQKYIQIMLMVKKEFRIE